MVECHAQLSNITRKSVASEAREGGVGEVLRLGARRRELPKDRGCQLGQIPAIPERRGPLHGEHSRIRRALWQTGALRRFSQRRPCMVPAGIAGVAFTGVAASMRMMRTGRLSRSASAFRMQAAGI